VVLHLSRREMEEGRVHEEKRREKMVGLGVGWEG